MALSDLVSAVDNYGQALLADSLNPQASYSLRGEMVSQSEWRTGIMALIIQLNKTINALNPYTVRTKVVL